MAVGKSTEVRNQGMEGTRSVGDHKEKRVCQRVQHQSREEVVSCSASTRRGPGPEGQ